MDSRVRARAWRATGDPTTWRVCSDVFRGVVVWADMPCPFTVGRLLPLTDNRSVRVGGEWLREYLDGALGPTGEGPSPSPRSEPLSASTLAAPVMHLSRPEG